MLESYSDWLVGNPQIDFSMCLVPAMVSIRAMIYGNVAADMLLPKQHHSSTHALTKGAASFFLSFFAVITMI